MYLIQTSSVNFDCFIKQQKSKSKKPHLLQNRILAGGNLGMVAHACSPGAQVVEARISKFKVESAPAHRLTTAIPS